MPGRFYFSPVRGRAGGVMAGVAEGIDRGVGSFNQARETARQVRRQETEDERRRLFEDVEMDDFLAQRGGGRGAAPTQDVSIQAPADLPEFELPEFSPQGPGVGMRAPELEGSLDFNPIDVVQRQDPRFRSVGPDGFGHVMTPEAIEQRDYDRALGRQDTERDALAGRIGPIAGAISSGDVGRGDGDQFGDAAARLSADGFNVFDFMPPEEDQGGWEPSNRDDYFRSRGRDPETGRLLDPRAGSGSGTDRARPTYDQAVDILTQLYADPDPSAFAGTTTLGADEMHRLATAMSGGTDPEFPAQAEALGETPQGTPSIGKSPGLSGWAQRIFPGGESGYQLDMIGPDGDPTGGAGGAPETPPAPGRQAAAPEGRGEDVRFGPDEDEIEQIRSSLARFPRRQWREILEEENAAVSPAQRRTPEEIDQILGGD